MSQYVIAYGNPFDGLSLIGPFDRSEEACDYATLMPRNHEWNVVELEAIPDHVLDSIDPSWGEDGSGPRVVQEDRRQIMKYRCTRCGGENLKREISFMVNPNTYTGEILDMNDAQWEDYFYCDDCEDEAHDVKEIEDDGE